MMIQNVYMGKTLKKREVTEKKGEQNLIRVSKRLHTRRTIIAYNMDNK